MLNAKAISRIAQPRSWVAILCTAILPFVCVPATAGIGNDAVDKVRNESRHVRASVLPASARPHGYALADMARITAAFNVSDRSGTVIKLPKTPFHGLFATADNPEGKFNVMQGETLYVPIVYNDDSLPVIGDFPARAENRHQLLKYWFSQQQFGVVATQITVDGVTKSLGGDYVSGVDFSMALPDGAKHYATTAVFIAPLSPGVHTIEYHFKATGDAFRDPVILEFFPDGFAEFSAHYTVAVR